MADPFTLPPNIQHLQRVWTIIHGRWHLPAAQVRDCPGQMFWLWMFRDFDGAEQ